MITTAKASKAELAAFAAHEASRIASERAADQRALSDRAKVLGMKRRRVRANDGSVKEVWCFSTSYHAMGFQDHQIAAAESFGRDWEGAYRGLRGQSFEPGVDGGGGANRFHAGRVLAQGRLSQCKTHLGQRAWEIVIGVVIHGATITGMMKAAQKDNRAIKADVEAAFNDLDAFYSGSRKKDKTWEAFEKFNAERAAMIERAEREVG